MGKQRKGEKNALTLVGLELVSLGQEARVLTIRPSVPPYAPLCPDAQISGHVHPVCPDSIYANKTEDLQM